MSGLVCSKTGDVCHSRKSSRASPVRGRKVVSTICSSSSRGLNANLNDDDKDDVDSFPGQLR